MARKKTIKKDWNTVKDKLCKFFNSPFFITFCGGAIVTLLTIFIPPIISENISKINKQVKFNRQLQTQQIKIMTEFADGISRWLSYSKTVKKRIMWLKDKDAKEKEFPDGRSFIETRDFYEKELDQLRKLKDPNATCAEAKAIFKSKKIHKKINLLSSTITEVINAKDNETYNKTYKKIININKDIIELMGKELTYEN
jgi:hypothetical protein